MLREIHLHGTLAAFGGPYPLDVATPAEAVRGLCVQIDGFAAALRAGTWRVVRGDPETGTGLDLDTLCVGFGRARALHITPAAEGAGEGKATALLIVGFALVTVATAGAAAATGPAVGVGAGFTVSSGVAGLTYGQIAMVGVALAVNGITQLLAPAPPAALDDNSRPSFLFDGAVNTIQQGHPVPAVYGQHLAGSVVVSSALAVEQIAGADTVETDPDAGAGAPPAGNEPDSDYTTDDE